MSESKLYQPSKVLRMISKEVERQDRNVELIASENFVSADIMWAMGSCLTNKYAEGYPGRRYYGGCEHVDEIETYCQEKWKEVFQTDYHCNVQPHSGSNANLAAFMAVLKPGDTVLSLSLENGGHLTHGSPVNFSGKLYNFVHYGLDSDGYLDYADLQAKIRYHKPKMILAGASAYPRVIDFRHIHNVIDRVREDDEFYDPFFMVDMSHVAGLVAAGKHPSPFGYADIITTTTHKTLRGPRGGLIFCRDNLRKKIDSAVFPGTQGGPLMHVIAAKAICAEEACTDEYKTYIRQVVFNCREMSEEFVRMGYNVITGGTDNHLFLLDLSKTHPHITGKMAQDYLDEYCITVNKNMVPGDTKSPQETSGLRIGTAAMTTLGWGRQEFINCAHYIDILLNRLEQMYIPRKVWTGEPADF